MKNNINIMKTKQLKPIFLALVASLTIWSCVQDDDFTVPESLGQEENNSLNRLLDDINRGSIQLLSITDLKSQFVSGDDAVQIVSDVAVKGYVSSSDATGNFYKEFFLQNAAENATDAIKVSLNQVDSYNQFNLGREVYIKLKDLYLGESNSGDGVFTIGGDTDEGEIEAIRANVVPSHIFRSSTTETIVPKNVSGLTGADVGIYVTIDNVEFPSGLVGKPYVDPSDDYDTQRTVQRCSGFEYSTFQLETSSFASFKNEVLVDGGGSISGVVSKTYNGDGLVLALNTTDDVSFGGSRCVLLTDDDFSVLLTEDFESYSNYTDIAGDWTNYNEEGNRKWRAKTTNDNQNQGSKIAYISAYNSGDSSNVAWMITPSIDLDAQDLEFINFKSSNSYSDNSELELLISTDWDGTTSGISSATWSNLSANIVSDDEYYQNWVDSGLVDLSAYSGTAYVAFKYTGGGDDYTGTFEIDDFQILVQN